ncbi:MAG: elongation factor P [bacterium]|jgi:elongation factor P
MALSNTELKKGTVFQMDGVPYKVIDYSQKVVGRGGSIVNVKIKSLIDGKVMEKTVKGSESIERAEVNSLNVQYLYNDGTKFYFMNLDNYDQFEVLAEDIEEQVDYLKEGDKVTAQFFNDQLIGIELPKTIALEVTYAENVVKGDTTSNVLKDATVETGKIIKVPAFVKTGDVIKINTETGSYLERVK